MSEQVEEMCVKRFLNWYNNQHKANYIHQRAEDYLSELKGRLRWEFVAYEPDNPQKWIAIEVKELPSLMEISIQFNYWRDFCQELTEDLQGKIQGGFEIHLPPSLNVKRKKQHKLREAFVEVMMSKESILKANEHTDIGPDIADKFTNWPKKKSDLEEYDKFGEYRPCKLEIMKIKDSECEVKVATSPVIGGDVVKRHREALNKVFNSAKANRQLRLAKSKGVTKTILLLACNSFDDEGLIKGYVQSLDRHLISDIDYIYFVDMGSKGSIVNIYQN